MLVSINLWKRVLRKPEEAKVQATDSYGNSCSDAVRFTMRIGGNLEANSGLALIVLKVQRVNDKNKEGTANSQLTLPSPAR